MKWSTFELVLSEDRPVNYKCYLQQEVFSQLSQAALRFHTVPQGHTAARLDCCRVP